MVNCEESTCTNIQSAICLHCLRRLCSIHILVHEKIVSKETNELYEQIDEVAEQLNISLQHIHTAYEESRQKLNIWRQDHIDKIKQKHTEQYQKDNLTKLEDELTQRLIKEQQDSTQLELNGNKIDESSVIQMNSFQQQYTNSQLLATNQSISSPSNQTISTTSPLSRIPIKRPIMFSSKKIVKYFKNISGSDDQNLENYIVKDLHSLSHVNNIMLVFLSLFDAWHSRNLSTVYNDEILSYHIKNLKKYIKQQEHQLTVIAAIQVFINNCKYSDSQSNTMFTNLFQFFLTNECITKETIIDWYKNGDYYGYEGFQKAKLWAQSFFKDLIDNSL
ncbi:unnamed protein product [Adineta steineri]|uniref:W2 domain-containing protein n=1 Tax=Adineta steineri TaxID=433720 RepID=A0A814IBI0_9BILA|nr:unnamed protein product [Adineta steineri]CAF3589809.1 unnamed protein product [Adineta steineri]